MNRFAKMKKERIYTLFETLSAKMKKERIYTLFETLSIYVAIFAYISAYMRGLKTVKIA